MLEADVVELVAQREGRRQLVHSGVEGVRACITESRRGPQCLVVLLRQICCLHKIIIATVSGVMTAGERQRGL
jgi:hypothetical protein